MSTFKTLGISDSYIKGLNELGIKKPTPIQERTIPTLLGENKDFIGLAQTGTGKTAAYGLPALHSIDTKLPLVQVLILSPTRELVQQIKKQLFKFTKYQEEKIFVEAVFGGEKIDRQINNLKRPTHIVVATPGRLIDLIKRRAIDIRQVKTVVLDEADEMLSMGFKKELNEILDYTDGTRKTWLFSATMPEAVNNIIKTYLANDTKRVEINKNEMVNANISHKYILTTVKNKFDVLTGLLDNKGAERGIIFCRTKLGVQKLTEELIEEGFSVGALEGDMQQKERDKVMRAFKKENLQVLVSTDVSARGIDVNNLEFIIHHQLPESNEYYTHRSGRTARAGKKGDSIALLTPSELERIYALQKALGIRFEEDSL